MEHQNSQRTMQGRQLELGLNGTTTPSPCPEARIARAPWWFERMRRTVAAAIDWSPRPPARPEQARLPLPTC